MASDILDSLEQAGIPMASATYEIVGLPPLQIEERGRFEQAPER